MKVKPASVHFLANTGFSLSWQAVSLHPTCLLYATHKAISWMYALTSLLLCDLYYPVSVEVCGWVTEVYGVWGA